MALGRRCLGVEMKEDPEFLVINRAYKITAFLRCCFRDLDPDNN